MKLLIVDSESQHLNQLQRLAEGWGYQVTGITESRKAKGLLESWAEPGIVLADWSIPDISNGDFSRLLKAAGSKGRHYVIVTIAKASGDESSAALSAGVDDFIGKPVQELELKNRLAIGKRILEYQGKINKLTDQLLHTDRELNRIAAEDGLTGLANKRQFEERYIEEWRRAARDGAYVSLLLIDLDYFRKFNEEYGYAAGDECIRRVAKTFSDNISRGGDLIARYDGDQFAVLLPNTDTVGATVVSEALRLAVSRLGIANTYSPRKVQTVSIGAVTIWPEQETGAEVLIQRATSSLRQAKAAGRNIVRQYR